MKRLLWLLAPLVLGGAVAKSDGFRLRDDVRGELRIGGRGLPPRSSGAAPYSFCSNLSAGQRVGNWGCVNGDATAAAGDHLGWTKTAGATVTTGTTCASPSYVTLTHATPDYLSTTNSVIDTLPSSWTFCVAYEQTSNANAAAFMVGAFPCCGSYNLTTEQQFGGQMTFYGGGGPTAIYAVTGQKVLACAHRSSGTTTAYFRIDGSTLAAPSFGGYSYSAITNQRFIVGAESGIYALEGKVFGAFYTETELVQADLDALYTAVYSCP